MKGRPEDYAAVIRANWKESLAVIIADAPDCIDRWQEFAVRGRRYEEDPVVSEATAYPGPQGVQARLGRWYNDWIYLDAQGLDWPGLWWRRVRLTPQRGNGRPIIGGTHGGSVGLSDSQFLAWRQEAGGREVLPRRSWVQAANRP